MRRLLWVFILLSLIDTTSAQIKIKRGETVSPKEQPRSYDSTDVSTTYPERYIGQKVIYYQNTARFFTKHHPTFDGTKTYDLPLFTYLEIVEFNPPQEFKLKRLDNGDTMYYLHFGDGNKPIMAVGYYEKYSRMMMGTEWAIEGKDGIYQIVDIWLREGGISQKLRLKNDTTEIELATTCGLKPLSKYESYIEKYKDGEWIVDRNLSVGKLKSVEVIGGYPKMVFVSNSGKEFYFDLEKSMQSACNNGLGIEIAPNFTKQQSDEYIRKFGIKRWKEILYSEVEIGMTQEMVLLSMGFPPNREIKMTDSSGNAVQWSFANSMDVLFVNGRVKHITHY